MGNTLGGNPKNGFNLYFHPDVTPDPSEEPTFKSEYGFEKARKERGFLLHKPKKMNLYFVQFFFCFSNDCYRRANDICQIST